jgi:Flp pilus assembly protein TadG
MDATRPTGRQSHLPDRTTSRRVTGDRGSAIVEFALVLPVFTMLILGTFSAAVLYNDKASMNGAAREGARYGATVPVDQCADVTNCAGLTWAQMVRSVAVERSAGSATTGDVCVALVSGTGATQAAVDSTHTTNGGTSPCWIDTSADSGLRVQVQITRSDDLNFMVQDIHVNLVSRATSKYEQ